jgi:small-conductance mechanosensitive channel
MRELPMRIAITAAALLVAAVGLVATLVFLCLALYSFFLTWLTAPLAALCAALLVLSLSLLVVQLSGILANRLAARARRERAKRGGPANAFSAELGRLLGEDAQTFINERPVLALFLALIGGFAVGANPKLRAFLQNFLKD